MSVAGVTDSKTISGFWSVNRAGLMSVFIQCLFVFEFLSNRDSRQHIESRNAGLAAKDTPVEFAACKGSWWCGGSDGGACDLAQ